MNGISGFTSKMRMTGLSGFDTESIVAELMKAERMPLDTLKQKRTIVEWRQEAYREISSSLIGFKSKFFDIVNRTSYLLSESSIKAMSASSSNSSYVTATASSGTTVGESSIKILQLATADSTVSSAGISKGITGTIDEEKLAGLEGKEIFVELDGVSKQITLGGLTGEDFVAELHSALDAAFGTTSSGNSKFSVAFDSGTNEFSINTANGATKVTVYGPTEATEELAGLDDLGLTAGQSNRLSFNSPLFTIQNSLSSSIEFDEEGNTEFSINGETITIKSTDTLEQVFDKINNNEKTKATINYDELTDKITITSKITGNGDNLVLSESSFFDVLNLGTKIEGTDAEVIINGETLIRSTNNFTVNGVTYNLNKVHEEADEGDIITIAQNTESAINNIKSFIEDYNKIIDSINTETSERYDRNFPPLTDEQRNEMDEKDIEKWEEKAKAGLLRNDSLLQQLTLSMRTALYETVEGVGISLRDIGIDSKSYADKGKLYLDEDKLKNALLSKPDEVTKLLNGVSADNPDYSRTSTAEQKADRYSKSGVLQRLSDIIEDHVSTFRNTDGRKGILLEKAGIEGDLSNTKNLISDQLDDYDDRINDMIEKLTRKEENYYKKFSALETMLARMNQQSAWITSQFSLGQ